jgi:hypothetical protein
MNPRKYKQVNAKHIPRLLVIAAIVYAASLAVVAKIGAAQMLLVPMTPVALILLGLFYYSFERVPYPTRMIIGQSLAFVILVWIETKVFVTGSFFYNYFSASVYQLIHALVFMYPSVFILWGEKLWAFFKPLKHPDRDSRWVNPLKAFIFTLVVGVPLNAVLHVFITPLLFKYVFNF